MKHRIILLIIFTNLFVSKAQMFDLEIIEHELDVTTGMLFNEKLSINEAFSQNFAFKEVDRLRFEFTNVLLQDGCYIKIEQEETGYEEIISNQSAKYNELSFYSAYYSSGHFAISLYITPQTYSPCYFTIKQANLHKKIALLDVQKQVFGNDTRVQIQDPCTVRLSLIYEIKDMDDINQDNTQYKQLFATGFMISDNWMLSAGYNFLSIKKFNGVSYELTNVLVERNVPPNGAPSANNNQLDIDEKKVIFKTGEVGKDWAVVKVKNKDSNIPGYGCKEQTSFACDINNIKKNLTILEVRGYGHDTKQNQPVLGGYPPYSLQTASETASSNVNPIINLILHKVDTETGNDGSPIRLVSNDGPLKNVVGIHTENYNWPTNTGTHISHIPLLKAIKQLCKDEICPGIPITDTTTCCIITTIEGGENCIEGLSEVECTDLGGVWETGCFVGYCNDEDEDGIPDALDNCPNTYNPDQANEDLDQFGDECDDCGTNAGFYFNFEVD